MLGSPAGSWTMAESRNLIGIETACCSEDRRNKSAIPNE
jgi:hypothetical protein